MEDAVYADKGTAGLSAGNEAEDGSVKVWTVAWWCIY